MDSPNPYQPPAHHEQTPRPHPDLPDGWVACPQCGGTDLQRPSFTWWGGALGPRLLNHVKCLGCGTAFNAKTGKSNMPAIIVYQVVALVIVLGLFYALDLL
jgi:rubredoxin